MAEFLTEDATAVQFYDPRLVLSVPTPNVRSKRLLNEIAEFLVFVLPRLVMLLSILGHGNALRVLPAVTRLTVYRGPQVEPRVRVLEL